jgi:GxxExxY protein
MGERATDKNESDYSPQSRKGRRGFYVMRKTEIDALTQQIIGAAIEVHRILGPRLLESAYETCLCHELGLRKIPFERQKELPVVYKGIRLDGGYRLDVLVADTVVLELKAVEKIDPIYKAQLLSYLRLGGWNIGLLMNFHVPVLKQGINRIVYKLEE